MTPHQLVLFALLGCVFGLLIWGRVRYDLVAFGALVIAVIIGVVPESQAFSGFGHSATVIIAPIDRRRSPRTNCVRVTFTNARIPILDNILTSVFCWAGMNGPGKRLVLVEGFD